MSGARPLGPQEILRLQALGALVSDAADRTARDLHIETVLLVVRAHRVEGVRWVVLARALGVTRSTLWRWRQRDRSEKPAVPTREPVEPLGTPDRPPGRAERAEAAAISATSNAFASSQQSQNAYQSATAVSTGSAGATLTGGVARLRRRVLILTGDPRPGGNLFDPEVAGVRDRCHGTRLSQDHVTLVGLDEVAEVVDRHRAVVVHLCAHSEDGGLALTLDGRPHFVAPDDLAAALERARHLPRCAVLSFCSSIEVAPRLARRIPAVIAWPEQVEDQQAACYSSHLYRHLASGRRLDVAVADAAHAVSTQWPELAPPRLLGPRRDPVV